MEYSIYIKYVHINTLFIETYLIKNFKLQNLLGLKFEVVKDAENYHDEVKLVSN